MALTRCHLFTSASQRSPTARAFRAVSRYCMVGAYVKRLPHVQIAPQHWSTADRRGFFVTPSDAVTSALCAQCDSNFALTHPPRCHLQRRIFVALFTHRKRTQLHGGTIVVLGKLRAQYFVMCSLRALRAAAADKCFLVYKALGLMWHRFVSGAPSSPSAFVLGSIRAFAHVLK